MNDRIVPTQSIELGDAARRFDEVVIPVVKGDQRVVIERDGKPIAAVVSTLDLQALEKLDAERKKGVDAMRRFSEAFADVPPEELERQIARALAEGWAEMRAEREAPAAR